MNQNKDVFFTNSLPLSAALQSVSSAKLQHVEFLGGSPKATFTFIPSQDPYFHQIVERFWNKQLQIDAITYFENLKFIKSRLYETSHQ